MQKCFPRAPSVFGAVHQDLRSKKVTNMNKEKEYILSFGKGMEKRAWSLSEEDFREFEMRFEEKELICISAETVK